MDAPQRVPTVVFNQLVDEWLKEHCYNTGLKFVNLEAEMAYACKKCGTDILWKRTFLSVHLPGWSSCCGVGEVINPTMPYCPKCEPSPNVFGCVHDEPEEPPQTTGWVIREAFLPITSMPRWIWMVPAAAFVICLILMKACR